MSWVLALALFASGEPGQTRDERLEALLGPAPTDAPTLPDERPDPLRLRDPVVAGLLGGAVGFGTGHYYAGDHTGGWVMSGVDSVLGAGALWAGLRALELRRDNDLRAGGGARELTDGEERLRGGLVALATGLLISRVYQAVFATLEAEETNRRLESYSFVPLP